MSERILSEDERLPSIISVWRYWMRTTYICLMWTNSPLSNIENELPSPENSDWKLVEGKYSIDWEDPAEMKKVEGNIKYLLRGCACKTGCSTQDVAAKKKRHLWTRMHM